MYCQLSKALCLFDEVFEAIEMAIHCSVSHAVELQIIRYLSFFNKIFQDLHVTTACCLYYRFFFRTSRRFHFVDKKSKTVEVSSNSSLFTRLFFIIRATIREAVLEHLEITYSCCVSIVLSSHSQCFTSLAHLRNSSLLAISNLLAKPGLIYHVSSGIFLSPGHVIPHQFQRRNR